MEGSPALVTERPRVRPIAGLDRRWRSLPPARRRGWSIGLLLGTFLLALVTGPVGLVVFLLVTVALGYLTLSGEKSDKAQAGRMREVALSAYQGPDAPSVTESFVPSSWTRERRAFQQVELPAGTALALDADGERLWFATYDPYTLSVARRSYRASDIVDVELREQTDTVNEVISHTKKDKTVTKASTPGMVGRAVLGGAVAGQFGGAAGALTAKRTQKGGHETTNTTERTTTMAHSLRLQLTLDDPRNPLGIVEFLDKPAAQTSKEYQAARANAERWFALVELLMRRAGARSS
jgi:hypothetical protein